MEDLTSKNETGETVYTNFLFFLLFGPLACNRLGFLVGYTCIAAVSFFFFFLVPMTLPQICVEVYLRVRERAFLRCLPTHVHIYLVFFFFCFSSSAFIFTLVCKPYLFFVFFFSSHVHRLPLPPTTTLPVTHTK